VSELTPLVSEFLSEMIPRVAARVHRDYPLVPAEDLEQEMWLYAFLHGAKLRDLLANSQEGVIWSELRRSAKRIVREDQRYRRAAKAAAEGYSPDDEQFYTIPVLRFLLPYYVDEGVSGSPPQGRDQSRTGHADGAESGDWMAMMIDVGCALEEIKPSERNLIKKYFGVRQDDTEGGRWDRQALASSMGMTLEALDVAVHRAVAALRDQLGGANPWPRASMTLAPAAGSGRTVPGSPSAAQLTALRKKG